MPGTNSTPDDNKPPKMQSWQKRRWKLFDAARKQAAFRQYIAILQRWPREKRHDADYAMELIRTIDQFQLPGDCMNTLKYLIDNPAATDEELIAQIAPPISYYSHAMAEWGPKADQHENYRMHQQVYDDARAEGIELEKVSSNLHLVVRPFTQVDEMIDFIRANKYDISRLLKPPTDAPFTPAKLRGNRVDAENPHLAEIRRLYYEEGLEPTEIAKRLPVHMEPSNIRRMISKDKKRRTDSPR